MTSLRKVFSWFTGSQKLHQERERLKTFRHWPITFISIRELASSGLYYVGHGDRTRCYFCNCEIDRWEPYDSPVLVHQYIQPMCPLLRRCQTTNVPIDEEYLNVILPPLPAATQQICKICFGGEQNILFTPCSHVVTCQTCALYLHKCPICRVAIKAKLRIFVV